MARVSKQELLERVVDAIREGGWMPVVIEHRHPFLVRATNGDRPFNLRVYVWNCTHGGGGRARDEFRIQSTSGQLLNLHGEETVLLGWHEELDVFAAWDVEAHLSQDSQSPSAQVKERTLEAAHDEAFASQEKENEVVVAFQPFLLMEYVVGRKEMHRTGRAYRDISLLNHLDSLDDTQVATVSNLSRRTIVSQVKRKYRDHKFSRKVLSAYQHRCAFCGIQLRLLDAAHIVPVSAEGSTDEVDNGLALCKSHHFAFDSNLVSFDIDYRIKVSEHKISLLRGQTLHGGEATFRRALRSDLALPADPRDRPSRANIRESLRVRMWRP